jgi:predicted transcriptional regulator
MKIGKYNRKVLDFAKSKGLGEYDVKILLLLNEVMWMGIDDIRINVASANDTAVRSLKRLRNKSLVKIARINNNFQRLARMYCITQKGRIIALEFINQLN